MPQATKESFARTLDALVRKYEADHETYRSAQYNEAQTRSQFITPFLEALGWDVRNEAGVPYNLCEVFEEKGETHGRPDYTFRINGQTKFFLEAKKPSGGLRDEDILQTKRYAWNSRDIFFAAICDFEDLYFFDASLRPDQKRPYDGEAFHITYTEYSSSIDKLWELSRDRVAAGSLDQFLRKDRKSLLQKVPVDKDFLDNLTQWRHDLANAIHAQNPEHDAHALNEIVQRLLDRIIFIRIAEDRKVIDQRQLWDIAGIWEESGGRRDIMPLLVELFRDFNARFNGEIFKPHACEEIKIEGHVLSKIIRQLYPPKSNYRFDVIGVELLGSIYERYLGNTLRITPKRVFIEPKPEVRKAGGVYYTPQYIVDYIVKNTVGKLVEGKTPKEVDKIRILDPACGSGSFLIGAFQFLIDWYLNYYRENPKEAKPGTIFALTRTDEDGNLRLSFAAKSLILQHNLYGVDIDQQAVEVTMMSLYLKMLEGELGIQIPKQDKLPELKYNIRCGNSLIGPDIEADKPLSPEERQRINPFDWNSRESGFGDILKSGGFDAVIGNPPWGGDIDNELDYFHARYPATTRDHTDSFKLFIEAGMRLARDRGLMSLIVPSAILRQRRLRDIRRFFFNNSILSVADLGEDVFKGVVAPSCIFVARKGQPGADHHVQLRDLSRVSANERARLLPQRTTKSDSEARQSLLADNDELGVRKAGSVVTDSVIPLFRAAQFRCKDAGINYQRVRVGMRVKGNSDLADRLLYEGKQQRRVDRMYWKGSDIGRYWISESTQRFCRPDAKPRKNEVVHLNDAVYDRVPKLLLRQTADTIIATIDYRGVWFGRSIISIVKESGDYEPEYLLALLNSKYLREVYDGLAHESGRVFAQVKLAKLGQLPFRRIDFSNPAEKKKHDRLVALAKQMFELSNRRQSGSWGKTELESLEREIAETDAQIDNLVYDLYGVTAEERKITEDSTGSV